MMENIKIHANCKVLYFCLRVVCYIGIAMVVFWSGYCIWLTLQPDTMFQSEIIQSGRISIGVAHFNQESAVLFNDMIDGAFVTHPKTAYILYHIIHSVFTNLFLVIGLIYMCNILKQILTAEKPFAVEISSYIFRLGVLIIVFGMFDKTVAPLLLSSFGMGDGEMVIADSYTLLAGLCMITLSYVFSYGMQLQLESDETL